MMESGPKLLQFPAPELLTTREALQKALDDPEPLTNVLILSQRENGDIYHVSSGMTMGEANWIIDSYWFYLHEKAASK